MTEVFVVVRLDRMKKGVVWKVYGSEDKAISSCEFLNNDEYSIQNGHRYKYEKWNVS